MCEQCESERDDLLFALHGGIHRRGYAIEHVLGSGPVRSWVHTVGLIAGTGHPELVAIDDDTRAGIDLLRPAAHEVQCHSGRFRAGDILAWRGDLLELVAVDLRHWEGRRFSAWHLYYEALGPPAPDPEALQVWRVGGDAPRLDEWDPDDPCR